MEVLESSIEKIYSSYKMINYGCEAEIFDLGNGMVLKLFLRKTEQIGSFKNKYDKLKRLVNLSIDGVVTPKDVIVDNDGNLLGYTMRKIDYVRTYRDYFTHEHSLHDKIEAYKKIEALMIMIHSMGISFIDSNPNNFAFDEQGNLRCLDTDNYMIGKYKCDLVPYIFAGLYNEKYDKKIDHKTDIYSFVFRFLQTSVYELHSATKVEIKDNSFIYEAIDKLIIPSELRNILFETVVYGNSSTYISDYLEMIRDQDKNYIKTR